MSIAGIRRIRGAMVRWPGRALWCPRRAVCGCWIGICRSLALTWVGRGGRSLNRGSGLSDEWVHDVGDGAASLRSH